MVEKTELKHRQKILKFKRFLFLKKIVEKNGVREMGLGKI